MPCTRFSLGRMMYKTMPKLSTLSLIKHLLCFKIQQMQQYRIHHSPLMPMPCVWCLFKHPKVTHCWGWRLGTSYVDSKDLMIRLWFCDTIWMCGYWCHGHLLHLPIFSLGGTIVEHGASQNSVEQWQHYILLHNKIVVWWIHSVFVEQKLFCLFDQTQANGLAFSKFQFLAGIHFLVPMRNN